MRGKRVYICWFAVHFLFVAAISSRELFWVLPRSQTIFPTELNSYWGRAEEISAAVLMQNSAAPKMLRQSLSTYFHLAGIDAGYGFFAPNVPGPCKLVFELHYPDGRTESRVPAVHSHASGLRVATMLDKIGRPQYDPIREPVVKMLASAVWREHSDAEMIRAVIGIVILPTANEFERGGRESNQFLYSYDFAFNAAAHRPQEQ